MFYARCLHLFNIIKCVSREEFKIKLSDHVRHSDYMKNQIDLIANERILGLKESYEELQRSRMELEERTQNLQVHSLIVILIFFIYFLPKNYIFLRYTYIAHFLNFSFYF